MTVVTILFALSVVAELLLFMRSHWNPGLVRNTKVLLAVILNLSFVGVLFASSFGWLAVIMGILGIYRVISLCRILKNRMDALYLYYVTRRTSLALALAQAAILSILLYGPAVKFSSLLWGLALLQASVGIVFLFNTIRTFRHTRIHKTPNHYAVSELPTVTVAIPARNETDDLIACLDSVIASDYPKLEILVLDDCSQDKRTPEIIRGYAHDGVRFLKGDVPPENWLAKNYAYSRLAHEASGELVLFCGVDVRFEIDTIRLLVSEMLTRQKRMVSLMPVRTNASSLYFSLTQTVRYIWEISPPRRLFNRPPVLSSCWLIYTNELKVHGGFAAVTKTITPEAYFAKKTLANDGYSFMRATPSIGLTSVKQSDAQYATAIRVRYPSLKRQLETVVLVTAFELLLFVGPLLLLAYALVSGETLIAVLACLALASMYISYALIAASTRTISRLLRPIMFLPVVFADIILMHISFYKYEFSDVIWKGRNVCVPVMETIPHLPKLEERPSINLERIQ